MHERSIGSKAQVAWNMIFVEVCDAVLENGRMSNTGSASALMVH